MAAAVAIAEWSAGPMSPGGIAHGAERDLGNVGAAMPAAKADRLDRTSSPAMAAPGTNTAAKAPRLRIETTPGTTPTSAAATSARQMEDGDTRRAGDIAAPSLASPGQVREMPVATPRSAPLTPIPPAQDPPPPAAASAEPEEEPGEILWSNKTAALTTERGDAGSAPAAGGRAMELAVPLRDGSFYLGDVTARISPSGEASIAKERLLQIAAPLLRSAALDRLKSIPDSDGYLALQALKDAGFDIAFDSGKVEMQIALSVDQRASARLSAGRSRETVASKSIAEPAALAGYVNMRAGAGYASRPFLGEASALGTRLALDGALRFSDIVLESAATFEAQDGLIRGPSRFVYDLPEDALRLAAGDISPLQADRQSAPELLGLSIEKSYQKLQPGRNIRATGSRSFRIERPSKVDVKANGHTIQRLSLRPGDYDIGDLPLGPGANDITLEIEDDVGNRRTLDFTVFSSRALLAEGISQWALSAGVASRYRTGGPAAFDNLYSSLDYDLDTPVVTGFYERGLTADLTGAVHIQAAPDRMMGGAGAAFQTAFGFFALDAALSQAVAGSTGFAAGIGYELVNFEGKDGLPRSLRLAADYYSAAFAGIDMPEPGNRTMLDLSAIYSQALPFDIAASLSGTYSFGRDIHADRYGFDISLSRPITESTFAGISAGYEQSQGNRRDHEEESFTAALRLSYRVDDRSRIDAGHELGANRSHLGYRYSDGSGVGSWSGQLDLDRTGTRDGAEEYGLGGTIGYTGNRAELSASQHNGLVGFDGERLDQRTTVSAGTALAFADGRFALGRPVSNGFAIVAPHDTLSASELAIGSHEKDRRGSSDFLGPALISDMSPYSPARIDYDVGNLPVGYDLGAGTFDLLPAYKSGYRLTVGSDYAVTAFGILLDGSGEPVALVTGTAREVDREGGPQVTVFTNRTGRFGAQGLRPGRWALVMASEPPIRFILDIPEGAVGLVKLDKLRPEAAR